MGLPHIPQNPNEKGNPRLSSLNLIGRVDVSSAERRRTGFAGFIGTLLLFTSFFAMAFASLDPTTNINTLFAYFIIWAGGFLLSLGFGWKLARRVTIKSEINAVGLGIVTGFIVLIVQMVLMNLGIDFSTNQSIYSALFAPVAETLAFVIAPYHLFRYNFPEAHWLSLAIPANLVFSVFHFYRYFARPDFLLVWIILVIGNTLFVFIYHITKNATAPMIAHFVVNLASNTQPVLDFLVAYIPLFIGMFIVFGFIYWVLTDVLAGGSRK